MIAIHLVFVLPNKSSTKIICSARRALISFACTGARKIHMRVHTLHKIHTDTLITWKCLITHYRIASSHAHPRKNLHTYTKTHAMHSCNKHIPTRKIAYARTHACMHADTNARAQNSHTQLLLLIHCQCMVPRQRFLLAGDDYVISSS